jgi:hypothetical protein
MLLRSSISDTIDGGGRKYSNLKLLTDYVSTKSGGEAWLGLFTRDDMVTSTPFQKRC